MTPPINITHDPQGHRFVIDLGDDQATLRYAPQGSGVLNYFHVYVPPSHRHRGLAGRLCIHAFEYAREHGFKVLPTCPFIAHAFLPRFPKYQDLKVQG